MIVKRQMKEQDIRDFFNLEMNKLEKSLGIAMFSYNSGKISFDENAISILNLSSIIMGEKYNIPILPKKLGLLLNNLNIDEIKIDSSELYVNQSDKEIIFKYEKQNNVIKIYIISMEVLLATEKLLASLNKVFKTVSNVFSVVTWWTDYDKQGDAFYQTDAGVKLLGMKVNSDKKYSVSEFQKVREKASKHSPFYLDCIEDEKKAYEKVRKNETDYFGGRTPAFTVDNEEVWVESYGKVLIRYPDGKPRLFVALDIYLSDFFEKSNQLSVLNSLINQGLEQTDIGIWYYQKYSTEGRYEFTRSHKSLMNIGYEITNENVSDKLDEHFQTILEHTPEYETYLLDWRKTHNSIFTGKIDSYKKVIPNNLDKNNPQWIEIRGTVIQRDEQGDVKLFIGVNVDITDTVNRNLELKSLRYENERLQLAEKLAIKAGNVLVWFQDFEEDGYTKHVYGNEMFTSKLGIKRTKDGLFSISALRKTIIKNDKDSKNLSKSFISKLNDIYTNKSNEIKDFLVRHKNHDTGEMYYFEHSVEIEDRYVNGNVKLVGGFMRDVTDRVERQKRIAYLANNDILTGLRNRNYFETFINSGIMPESYSVLLFDLDGLKLINDAFGHLEGDKAIKQVARILVDVFKKNLFISRIGGDEFLVVTSNTDPELITNNANIFEERLKEYNEYSTIELNVSKGGYVVEDNDAEFEKAFTHAENLMYRRKLNNRSSRKSKVLESILETLNQKTEETKEHSHRIEDYVTKISKALGISRASDLEDLRLLAKVHDIGKITIPDNILNKPTSLTDDEFEVVKKHSEAGYKIIKNITDSDFVCEAVLSHHEHFDGSGYPQGLKGNEIPLFARIISVADAFDAMTNDRVYHKAISKKEAIEEIVRCSGTHFDPDIVQAFLKAHFDIDSL